MPIGYSNIEKFGTDEGYDYYNLTLDTLQYEKQNERTNQIVIGISSSGSNYLDILYGHYHFLTSGSKLLVNINKDLSYNFYYNHTEDGSSFAAVPSDFHFIPPKRDSAQKIFASMYPEDIVIFSRKRNNDSDNTYDYFWGKVTSVNNNYFYTIETNIEDLIETNDYYLNPGHIITDAQDVFNDSNITFYTMETGDPVPHVITEIESSISSIPNITISNPYCVYGSNTGNVTRIQLND